MKGIWIVKWPLIIFLVGFFVRLVGAFWKIRHWPMADEIITIGYVICGIAVVWGIIILVTMRKPIE